MEEPVYCGSSMYRVFAPGEHLILKELEFKDIQAGDVLAVIDPGGRQYVHRAIRKRSETWITMGDNNPSPDREVITMQSDFKLVVAAVECNGSRRDIAGGRRGMRVFRRNRFRRAVRLLLRDLAAVLSGLCFWRKRVYEYKKFGSEKCFYYREQPIGRSTADGRIIYSSWKACLKYRICIKYRDTDDRSV